MVTTTGTIRRLKSDARHPRRVRVQIDGRPDLVLTLSAAVGLRVGQRLDEADIARLQHDQLVAACYGDALRFLASRSRSCRETRCHLEGRGHPGEMVAVVLRRLERDGYLDDRAFARAWVEHRRRRSPRGRHALKFELARKGIPTSVIGEALAEVDEAVDARAAATAKLRQWRGLDADRFRQKLMRFLTGRGFSFETARQTVRWAADEHRPDTISNR
jgi:regulatory protein